MTNIAQYLQNCSEVTCSIVSLAVMMIGGYLMTYLTRLVKLPNVTAYIVSGILLGPHVLNVIPVSFIAHSDFVGDIALAFIAFSTGEYFKIEAIRRNGFHVLAITLCDCLLTMAAVFCVIRFIFRVDLGFSIVLAALASATAPASTMMTIRQTRAHGEFVNTLIQVIALDNLVGLIEYSIVISVVSASQAGSISFHSVILPLIETVLLMLLGAAIGWLLSRVMDDLPKDERLIITLASMLIFCAVCSLFSISPLLGCMSMGALISNRSSDAIFEQMNSFAVPVLLLFFVRSGANLNIAALVSNGSSVAGASLAGIVTAYFLIRIIGKYAGAYAGCIIAGKNRTVRNYLGLALIPQAGVAIGLAALGARVLGGETGEALSNIILATSVLYELVGPACAKAALHLAGSYNESDQ
ncbi:MAG: cation:proton antiporter [Erysipelotrichaceae bacterium]|nr:cation:proton antiporter [Erysipelotrichaceae bacterium]